jgi:hypothetical protein
MIESRIYAPIVAPDRDLPTIRLELVDPTGEAVAFTLDRDEVLDLVVQLIRVLGRLHHH